MDKKDIEKLIKEDLAKEPVQEKKKPNWFKRKAKKVTNLFSTYWVVGKTGFLMGSFVGSVMGLLGGSYAAFQSKSFLPIPIAMVSSSLFFGSLMGIGSCLRTEEIKGNTFVYLVFDKDKVIKKRI